MWSCFGVISADMIVTQCDCYAADVRHQTWPTVECSVLHSLCSKKWSSIYSLLFSYNFSLSTQSYLEISSFLCWADVHTALFFNFISNRLFLACKAVPLTQWWLFLIHTKKIFWSLLEDFCFYSRVIKMYKIIQINGFHFSALFSIFFLKQSIHL